MKPEEIEEMILKEFPDAKVEIGNNEHELLNLPILRTPETLNPFLMIVRFPNNYGASIIRHEGSYGTGLQVEIAVILFEGHKWEINYETPITNDVLGYLEESEIIRVLKQIGELKS